MLRSLRNRLFLMIVLPLLCVALLAAALRQTIAERDAERLFDHTLHAVALAISRDVVLSEGDVLAEELLDSLVNALGDPIYYRITGPDGRFVTGYSDPPESETALAELTHQPQFYDAVYHGDPVRALVFREFIAEPQFGGWVQVQVWQTVRERDAHSWHLVMLAAAMMTAIILAAGAIVWFGIHAGLRPLTDLRDAVARRSPDDLGMIRRPVPPEVNSLVDAMNALFQRLARAFAVRDAFISDAAHQLRNPIAGIQAQAEAAESAPDETELRARVAGIAEAARRTSRLTQQLLSLEKIKGRDAETHHVAFDLDHLAAEVMKRHAPDALRRGVNIAFDVEGEPKPMRGDPVMLTEALDNLIDNALRYGCADGGELELRLTFAPDGARLTVRDQGPGVPVSERERIFERFHRAVEDGVDGCGLGLAIVREVAERHGGQVSLADTIRGACFDLRLPYPSGMGMATA